MSNNTAHVARFAQTAAIHTTVVNAGVAHSCASDSTEVVFGVATAEVRFGQNNIADDGIFSI